MAKLQICYFGLGTNSANFSAVRVFQDTVTDEITTEMSTWDGQITEGTIGTGDWTVPAGQYYGLNKFINFPTEMLGKYCKVSLTTTAPPNCPDGQITVAWEGLADSHPYTYVRESLPVWYAANPVESPFQQTVTLNELTIDGINYVSAATVLSDDVGNLFTKDGFLIANK